MARPNKGVLHLQGLPGSRESKLRGAAIWRTMNGELSVSEACERIGVGPTQFANLRAAALLGYLGALQPKAPGRPRRMPVEVEQELLSLRAEATELRRQNHLLRTQVEVMAVSQVRSALRSKSGGAAASRAAPPRADAAGRAIPRPSAEASSGP